MIESSHTNQPHGS